MQLTTTLNRIQMCNPSPARWQRLLKYLGKTVADDEPLPFSVILDSNGLEDALWCCRTAPEYDQVWRLYTIWCARQVQCLMIDPRSLNALDVAERYANGQATDEELSTAWIGARGAGAAAQAAAWVTAKDICKATGVASHAAAWATEAIARANILAAWEAARAAQAAKFREMISGG